MYSTESYIHMISFEPIRRRSSVNSFHELSINFVSKGVIGEFWRVTKRELARLLESKAFIMEIPQHSRIFKANYT